MVAGMPSIFAAAATPWAWLPEEKATTPARACARVELHEPVVGAADLERAGALQRLDLEQEPAAQSSRRAASRRAAACAARRRRAGRRQPAPRPCRAGRGIRAARSSDAMLAGCSAPCAWRTSWSALIAIVAFLITGMADERARAARHEDGLGPAPAFQFAPHLPHVGGAREPRDGRALSRCRRRARGASPRYSARCSRSEAP